MNDLIHQAMSGILIIIGCIKAAFGFFIMRKSVRFGDHITLLRHPHKVSFRMTLALVKLTSDAPLYIILGVQVARSNDPIYFLSALWLLWCFIIQSASFLKWTSEQESDRVVEEVYERP